MAALRKALPLTTGLLVRSSLSTLARSVAVNALPVLGHHISATCRSVTASMSSAAKATTYTPEIDFSKMTKELTKSPKPKQKKEELKFGTTMTDHMLEIDWVDGKGWSAPRIVPYHNLSVDPAASVFHYALECFEGMKAYKDAQGNLRLFRPDKNMARMNNSNERLLMPKIDAKNFLDCIKELVRVDADWVPEGYGYSLYLRPCCISTYPHVGVAPTKQVKLFCILSPVGPYYPSGFQPVKLFADPNNVRAWPGGTGNVKVGSNYALGIRPQYEAAKKGYAQILWIFGEDQQVTEVGTMNQFFFWINKQTGRKELVTAPLDGTILPGVTRDSILQLTREWKEFDVSERKYTLKEVTQAIDEGRLLEAFGAGTAAIVAPVNGVAYGDKEWAIPLDKDDPSAKAGPLARRLTQTIMDIQYGKVKHPWSVVI